MNWLKVIAPIGKFLRLFPLLRVFTVQELEQSLTHAGFELEHPWPPTDITWQLGSGKVAFIVAKKAT